MQSGNVAGRIEMRAGLAFATTLRCDPRKDLYRWVFYRLPPPVNIAASAAARRIALDLWTVS
ncbi:MAG: hypothetical protein ACI92Z_003417 [Paracoccaceae bacterium]|jgi:hypothetical protein